MLLTGAPVTAERAYGIGLITEIADPGQAVERALHVASALAKKSAGALTSAKQAVRGRDARATVEDAEEDCFADVWGSEDWREGIEALLARRSPVFERATRARGGSS